MFECFRVERFAIEDAAEDVFFLGPFGVCGGEVGHFDGVYCVSSWIELGVFDAVDAAVGSFAYFVVNEVVFSFYDSD